MTLHLLGLPHTETIAEWCTCAFTTKIGNLSQMLTKQGHDVVLYGGERNDALCTEHVQAFTEEHRNLWFGEETWESRVFDRWDSADQCWTESNELLIDAIRQRIAPGDMIAITIGSVQKAVADAFPEHISFESGVGYEGQFLPYRVFESYAWMHYSYGRQGISDGRFYDTVIPNAYDPEDFCFSADGKYLLFLGRHIPRKGLAVVEELAKNHRVITAGQGDLRVAGAEYAGVVRGEDRAALLAGASALIAPTLYIEPFGGVAVEAQICGTPVISVPWGAFSETVVEGETGFLCHTLAEFEAAVSRCGDLDPWRIRERALARYSTEAVAPMYSAYLDRLTTLHGEGWYAKA